MKAFLFYFLISAITSLAFAATPISQVTQKAGAAPFYFFTEEIDSSMPLRTSGIFDESAEPYVSEKFKTEAENWFSLFNQSTRLTIQFRAQGTLLAPPMRIFTHPLGSESDFTAMTSSVRQCGTELFYQIAEHNFKKMDDKGEPWVEALDLFGGSVDNCLDEMLQMTPGLKVLALPFTGTDFRLRVIHFPKSLQKLVVYNSVLTPSFFEELKSLTNLQSLVLWGCAVEFPPALTKTESAEDTDAKYSGIIKSWPSAPASLESFTMLNCARPVVFWARHNSYPKLKTLELGPGTSPLTMMTINKRSRADFPELNHMRIYSMEKRPKALKNEAWALLKFARDLGLSDQDVAELVVSPP